MIKLDSIKLMTLLLIACTAVFSSCSSSDDDEPEEQKLQVEVLKGKFITCEGDFEQNNGTVYWYGEDGTQSDNNLFKTVNNTLLGDVVQSFEAVDTLGFIVANGSGRVEVVHMANFKSVSTIEDLSYPRFVKQAGDNKVYITNGNGYADNQVVVYNLETLSVTKNIAVDKGPEKMALVNGFMYVTNSGGYDDDKTVSVIDVETDEVVKTITVNYAPVDIEVDKNNNLWVLCKGGLDDNWAPLETAKIVKINTADNTVANTFDFGGSMASYGNNLLAMSHDGNTLYYENGGIFKMSIDATALPTEAFIAGAYYGISVDPTNGKIYGMDATAKIAKEFSPDNGAETGSFNTGSYPNNVVFVHNDYEE
ncbi:hypothetical protein EYV94_21285 [Puteibacter caeruleilacunae]|nr:hypothetical protein EYV94_21285 [Puteibacter caeruleilacunae]